LQEKMSKILAHENGLQLEKAARHSSGESSTSSVGPRKDRNFADPFLAPTCQLANLA